MTEFLFETRAPKRIVSAAINITFGAKASAKSVGNEGFTAGAMFKGGKGKSSPTPPAVIALAPEGCAPIVPTERSFKVEVPVELAAAVPLDAGAAVRSVSDATEWAMEGGKVSADTATISGAARTRNYRVAVDARDTARWILMQNVDEKSGIPDYMRTAILVERADGDADFVATVDVSVTLSGGKFSRQPRQRVVGGLSASNTFIYHPRGDGKEGGGKMEVQVDVEDLDTCWVEAVKSTRAAVIHMPGSLISASP